MAGPSRRPEQEITLVRSFDAPRELVFRAWTEPQLFARWFGPHGYTTPVSTVTMDPRPGGTWQAVMISDADGTEYPTGGTYREVAPPERLVFTAYGSVVTVTFADLGGKTELVLHQVGTLLPGTREGWSSSLDRLVDQVTRTKI
jgi:uncharacterized protein YndB with AHSA1/START domain